MIDIYKNLIVNKAKGSSLRIFILSAGCVLAITGGAKVFSAFGNAKLLSVDDPILGIPFKILIFVVGLMEIGIAAVCFTEKMKKAALCFVTMMATSFLVYRIGLWLVGWKSPCNCMGNLSDKLHISSTTADSIMKLVLAYLLIGSYASLFWLWREHRKVSALVVPQ